LKFAALQKPHLVGATGQAYAPESLAIAIEQDGLQRSPGESTGSRKNLRKEK
jgi:hypothetical protein